MAKSEMTKMALWENDWEKPRAKKSVQFSYPIYMRGGVRESKLRGF